MGIKRSRSVSPLTPASPFDPPSPEMSPDVKIIHLDPSTSTSTPSQQQPPTVMKCSLPPHQPLTFPTFEAYDTHYLQTHTNRCTSCHKNFPDNHFLNLHIAENHDPISATKRDRGEKTYACLVSQCERLCSTAFKRRLHCIDKHGFPKNFDFFVVNDGIDRRSSLLRSSQKQHRRRSSTMNSTTSNGNRRRSSTIGSSTGGNGSQSPEQQRRNSTFKGNGEEMDLGEDDEEEDSEKSEDSQDGPKSPSHAPVRLRGRGGFGHGSGRGRGRGRGFSSVSTPSSPPAASKQAADPMDGLTSSMSALKFIPHAVRSARGRGAGAGTGA